ncbi:hypothetical protein ACFPZL_03950 [Leucobacter soli]|uniref:hypothetical protein n=1 Tax=Leucobacter soli TaxID=2812850 RepID=UPI001C406535|nr:hypothetical protein [Leucobacter soli]
MAEVLAVRASDGEFVDSSPLAEDPRNLGAPNGRRCSGWIVPSSLQFGLISQFWLTFCVGFIRPNCEISPNCK